MTNVQQVRETAMSGNNFDRYSAVEPKISTNISSRTLSQLAADEFADQQRAIAETQKAAADEEAGSAQAWMDDYTNLSGAVAVLLGISEEEFSNLEVDEQVEAVMSAVKASIDAEDASADEDPS